MTMLAAIWMPWLTGILLVALGGRLHAAVRRLVALGVLGACLLLLVWLGWRQEEIVYLAGWSLRWEPYALFVQMLVLCCAVSGLGLCRRSDVGQDQEALLLLVAAGGCFLAVANDLVAFLAGVAAFSAPAWIMAVQAGVKGREAAIKAMLVFLAATTLAGLGTALCMFWAGSTNLVALAEALRHVPEGAASSLQIGFLLWLAGMTVMLAAAPWHMWFVDLVDGQPAAGFLLVGSVQLVALLAATGRVMLTGFTAPSLAWPDILHVIGFVALWWGNLAALGQRRLRRMLANLAAGQVGFLLLGLAAAGRLQQTTAASWPEAQEAAAAVLVFILVCGLTWIGSCLPLGLEGAEEDKELSVDDLSGLSARAPGLALVVGLSLLCAAGMPPTVGFLARFWLLAAMVDADWTTTALLSALSLALVMANSLGWVAALVKRAPAGTPASTLRTEVKMAAAALGGALVALSLLPSGVFDVALRAAKAIF